MFVRIKTAVLVVLVCAGLGACGGGGGSSGGQSPKPESASLAQQIEKLEASGQLPRLDRSSNIRGPDADNNGIRDDIDAWIAGQPITDAQKRAAQQAGRVMQRELLADLDNRSLLDELGDLSMAAVKCLGDSFKPDYQKGLELNTQIEAMTANTRERAKRYLAYNRAASGSSGRLPEGNSCEP